MHEQTVSKALKETSFITYFSYFQSKSVIFTEAIAE